MARYAPLLAFLLAACAVLPSYQEFALRDLKVRHGDRFVGYMAAIAPLPAPAEAPLPTAPVQTFELPPAFDGWKLYDANADGVIDDGEQTVAWLERLHEMKTGRTARLLLPNGKPASGVALSPRQSARVRAALAATGQGAKLMAETERFLADVRAWRGAVSGLVLWPASR